MDWILWFLSELVRAAACAVLFAAGCVGIFLGLCMGIAAINNILNELLYDPGIPDPTPLENMYRIEVGACRAMDQASQQYLEQVEGLFRENLRR
jgi:hypothetical protein